MRGGRKIIYRVTDATTGAAYNASVERSSTGAWQVHEVNDRFNATGGIDGRELDPDVRHKVVSLFSKIAVDGRDPYGDPYDDDYDGYDD